MLFEELMKDEYNAGKLEGKLEGKVDTIISFLSDIAPVSEDLKSRIASIDNLEMLTLLSKEAAKVKTVEEFENYLDAHNY